MLQQYFMGYYLKYGAKDEMHTNTGNTKLDFVAQVSHRSFVTQSPDHTFGMVECVVWMCINPLLGGGTDDDSGRWYQVWVEQW